MYNQFISCYISCLVLNVGNDGGAVGALAALFTVSFFIIIFLLSTLLICTVTICKLKSKLHSQEVTGTAIHNTKALFISTVHITLSLISICFNLAVVAFPRTSIASYPNPSYVYVYYIIILCSCCIECSSLLHIIIQIHLTMKPFIVKEMGVKPEQKRS